MRGRILTPLAALVFAFPLALRSQQPTRPAPINIPLARKAVVTIQALDASGQLMASGTGFFVTEGYVVTAAHVLEDAAGCRIEMSDGQQQRCAVAAADTVKDVAMLTVSGSPSPMGRRCSRAKTSSLRPATRRGARAARGARGARADRWARRSASHRSASGRRSTEI